ncbi:MAG: undecaprenyldiphospho-muramoylpentapeptide beta-N-acetylglucosaminyltransferase [Bacteroidia bacterium]|nr:undecaprenyldiphospho-muramoylpentapeptide beta-N-acetylglucosaminyltransferase [Bacteroidia bacterium]
MNLRQPEIRVIISGGGTGGHIFPAIAIANAILEINNGNKILFVGATGRMEMEKVPAAGYEIEGLPISGIRRSFSVSNLMLPFRLFRSLMKARRLIKRFNPDIAVGVGGYASGPLLFAATSMGIPALIQEQNSFAGLTNKWLSRRVKVICVAYEGMEKYFPKEKILLTGNPVRKDLQDPEKKRPEGMKFFRLNGEKKTVLIIGGSLGAGTINRCIQQALGEMVLQGLQVIWQTGKGFYHEAVKTAEGFDEKGVRVFDFINNMDYAYAVADLVVSRAGASSVSELQLAGKPCILVPSPNVAEDHQTRNAEALSQRDAAVLVHDREAHVKLAGELMLLINDAPRMRILAENIRKMALPGAAEKIAREVYRLAGVKHQGG